MCLAWRVLRVGEGVPLSSLASPSVGRGCSSHLGPGSACRAVAGADMCVDAGSQGIFFFGWLLVLVFCCFVLPFLRYD